MEQEQDVRTLLFAASDNQLDSTMKPLIRKWDNPPKAIQILEVLDYCVYGSLASGFMVTVLEFMLDDALKREGTTQDKLAIRATWRK